MSVSSSVKVVLVSANAAKAQPVALPRAMTVAELQRLARRNVTFSVDDCAPAGTTTLGDLYDMCAAGGVLEVRFSAMSRMGQGVCTPCCACGYEGVNKEALERASNNTMQDIQNSTTAAAQEAARQAQENAQNQLNNAANQLGSGGGNLLGRT